MTKSCRGRNRQHAGWRAADREPLVATDHDYVISYYLH